MICILSTLLLLSDLLILIPTHEAALFPIARLTVFEIQATQEHYFKLQPFGPMDSLYLHSLRFSKRFHVFSHLQIILTLSFILDHLLNSTVHWISWIWSFYVEFYAGDKFVEVVKAEG